MSATIPPSFLGSSSSFRIRPVKTTRGALIRIVACANTMTNPYEVLRVKETASTAEIKAAYRGLAKRFHPDADPTNKNRGSEFVEIQRAYEALSDPATKAKFDCERNRLSYGSVGIERIGFENGEVFRTRNWETDQCW